MREAADKVGLRFAALKAKGRTDLRIYGRVCALAAKGTCRAVRRHFLQSLKAGFVPVADLNLSLRPTSRSAGAARQDAKVCGLQENLAEDKTELLFDKSELEGCSDAVIAEPDEGRESSRYPQVSRFDPRTTAVLPWRRRGGASHGPASARLTVLT